MIDKFINFDVMRTDSPNLKWLLVCNNLLILDDAGKWLLRPLRVRRRWPSRRPRVCRCWPARRPRVRCCLPVRRPRVRCCWPALLQCICLRTHASLCVTRGAAACVGHAPPPPASGPSLSGCRMCVLCHIAGSLLAVTSASAPYRTCTQVVRRFARMVNQDGVLSLTEDLSWRI
jgi:hypothetical protein